MRTSKQRIPRPATSPSADMTKYILGWAYVFKNASLVPFVYQQSFWRNVQFTTVPFVAPCWRHVNPLQPLSDVFFVTGFGPRTAHSSSGRRARWLIPPQSTQTGCLHKYAINTQARIPVRFGPHKHGLHYLSLFNTNNRPYAEQSSCH